MTIKKNRSQNELDKHYMTLALHLAQKAKNRVAPNPQVGCVIVKNKKIIASGWHKRFGGPHAEIEALKSLSSTSILKGATLYVTLEPCHHFGKTPPCVDALLKLNLKRVVIAMKDPNPLTCGRSIQKLKKHKIPVTVGVCAYEAQQLNKEFIKNIKTELPYVIVKIALSQDNMITAQKGSRTQITGPESQRYVQKLRQTVDAVLVGKRTIDIDDPLLTVRQKKATQPLRVFVDSRFTVSLKAKIFHEKNGAPVVVCTTQNVSSKRLHELKAKKIYLLKCRSNLKKQVDIQDALRLLKSQFHVRTLLVEGGGEIIQSFSKVKGGIDEWHILQSSRILGQEGYKWDPAPYLKTQSLHCQKQLGRDELKIYTLSRKH